LKLKKKHYYYIF